MFELETRAVREAVELPRAFVLVGQGGPNVVGSAYGAAPLLVDAEGVVLRSGAVYAWCRTGCCTQVPRQWPSVDAAADYHGSVIVEGDGTRPPDDPPVP
jgi:hypothetical protein